MGFPLSKNNCHNMIGDTYVFDETFARQKERERHSKKLDEHHIKTADDLSLNYIKLNNSQINY
jgi:hypothetical protein